MTAYQKPRPRKGYVLSYVSWNRDGTVREARYDPLIKAAPLPPDHVADAGKMVRPRGALAAEQQDLFGAD